MKVTIIITTHNRPAYLKQAIQSAIEQNFSDYEILVVSDGDPGAEKVTREFPGVRFHLLSVAHGGRSQAVNAGIDLSKGDYICALDDDDLMLPNKLTILSTHLDTHPEDQAVCSLSWSFVSNPGQRMDIRWQHKCGKGITFKAMLQEGNYINGATLLYRKEGLGWFDTAISTAEEYELHIRLLSEGRKIGFVPIHTALYRTHAGNKSALYRRNGLAAQTINRIKQKYCHLV